jgi:hypothetical protein
MTAKKAAKTVPPTFGKAVLVEALFEVVATGGSKATAGRRGD